MRESWLNKLATCNKVNNCIFENEEYELCEGQVKAIKRVGSSFCSCVWWLMMYTGNYFK